MLRFLKKKQSGMKHWRLGIILNFHQFTTDYYTYLVLEQKYGHTVQLGIEVLPGLGCFKKLCL